MYSATKFFTSRLLIPTLWVFSLLMLVATSPALAQGQDEGEAEEPIIVTEMGGYQSAQRALRQGALGVTLDSTRVTTFGGQDEGEAEEPIIVTEMGGYQSAQRALRRGALGVTLDSTRVTTFGGQDEGEAEEPIIVTEMGGYQSAQREQAFRADVAGVRGEAPPASPTLLGNYPNPFNPTTTISFNLPEAQFVRLAVFDVLGRQMQVLANGPMEAGRHEVRFLAGDLPSGLYLARLATPSGVIVRSMLLTK